MRLITILILWSPVLTCLYFEGIRGQNNPFDVTFKFKQRHVRQGDCTGIYDYRNVWQSFRENLEQTARAWPEFKDNRTRNTFILSRHKTVTEIAQCISRLVLYNQRGRPGRYPDTVDVDVEMNAFMSTCRFKDIQLAVMNDIVWDSKGNVYIASCRCGETDFTVSYIRDIYKIHHFGGQRNLPRNSTICV